MATIYWRNGWAWARAQVKGEPIREPLGTRNKGEAQERFQQFLARIEADKNSKWVKRETTFDAAARVFMDEHLPTLRKSSHSRYLQSLGKLTPHFEALTLQGISRADLTKYVASERRRGVSDSTIRRDLACLSSLFTVAADYELCDANPVLSFLHAKKKAKQLNEADFRTRYLSHLEELALLRQARSEADAMKHGSPRWHEKFMILCAFALYIDTGLRAQELLLAERSWLNYDGPEIIVPGSVAKNGKERRVPLTDRALAILEQIPEHKPKTGKPSPYILWRCSTGKRFKDLNKTLQRIAGKVGIKDITIHDLRRTCGCRLLQDRRMAMVQVSQWLGHASTDITEKRYAFLKVENLQEALGRKLSPEVRLQVGSFFDGPEERTNAGTLRLLTPINTGDVA
jgi:integrase/recombinase XerD